MFSIGGLFFRQLSFSLVPISAVLTDCFLDRNHYGRYEAVFSMVSCLLDVRNYQSVEFNFYVVLNVLRYRSCFLLYCVTSQFNLYFQYGVFVSVICWQKFLNFVWINFVWLVSSCSRILFIVICKCFSQFTPSKSVVSADFF